MADLSDVTAAIKGIVVATVYPNGTSDPLASIVDAPIRVEEGWPLPGALDLDLAGKALASDGKTVVDNGVGPVTHISIFPQAGAQQQVFQVLDAPFVITPAVHGVSASIDGDAVTLSGTPGPDEYVTIIADGRYIESRVGSTLAAILAALLADFLPNYSSATVSGDTITIAGAASLVVRIGAPAVLGNIVHRQRHAIMVSVWSPTPGQRAQLTSLLDIALKQNLKINLPDTTQAILVYSTTNTIDSHEAVSIYRRDLVFTAEYPTVETITAYEVTSFTSEGGPSVPAGYVGVPIIE